MRNWECGMRKKKKKEVFEFGIRNAECGKKKRIKRAEDRGQRYLKAECGKKKRRKRADLGFIRFRILDLGFGIWDSNDKEWKRNAAQIIDQVFSVYRLTQST